MFAVNRFADSGKAREQVLRFHRPDLRNRLPFHAHHVVFLLVQPDHPVEKALPREDLAGLHLQHPAIHFVHRLFTFENGLIIPQAILRQYHRLDISDVGEILIGKNQVFEPIPWFSDKLLGALVLRRKDNVAHFAIATANAAVRIEFVESDSLVIGVFVPFGLGFGFAMSGKFSNVGWRIVGRNGNGRARSYEKAEC